MKNNFSQYSQFLDRDLNPCSVECEQDSWSYSKFIYSTLDVAPSYDGPFVTPHRSSVTIRGRPGVTHSNTQSASNTRNFISPRVTVLFRPFSLESGHCSIRRSANLPCVGVRAC